jgi:hypothetical protein
VLSPQAALTLRSKRADYRSDMVKNGGGRAFGRLVLPLAVCFVLVAGSAQPDEPTASVPSTEVDVPPVTSVPTDLAIDRSVGGFLAATRVAPPQRRAVLIGDSAMAGVRWNGALGGFRGFFADHRLESCRRLVAMSCRGREGRRPVTALTEVLQLGVPEPTDVLVVATGYNDWYLDFDWQARMVLDAAQTKGFQTVVWVTYREDVTYQLPSDSDETVSFYAAMNNELDVIVASGNYPELQLWDLNRYTGDTKGWFHVDGVHEQRLGSWGVADWVSRHMAALDNRPCPMPWNGRIGQEHPCPNPDGLPPVRGYPDLVRLYNL